MDTELVQKVCSKKHIINYCTGFFAPPHYVKITKFSRYV